MTTPIVVVGAGGFGREILDVIKAINAARRSDAFSVLGVIDAAPNELNLAQLEARDIRYLGTEEEWLSSGVSAEFAIGIGSPEARHNVSKVFETAGLAPATLIHPSATTGSSPSPSEGTIICAGVRITTNVRIGRHVHVNLNATIGHDTVIEDFVSINPGANVSGNVRIREGVLVGVGSAILQGVTVGPRSTIGASACVVRDVPEDTTVKGVPAR